MNYVVIYRTHGTERWTAAAAFDDSDDALRCLRAAMRAHPEREYEMHPVHPHIVSSLILEATPCP